MNDDRVRIDEATTVRSAGARPTAYTLALNGLPLLYVVAGMVLAAWIEAWSSRVWLLGAWVYLLPPLLVRTATACLGACEGTALDQTTRAYKVWWFSTQMQLLFNRLPVLEETLRLVPGLYALWLGLWGSRVSTKVYWAAGSLVTDRTLIDVGEAVVIGTRAVLAPHLGFKDETGQLRVTIARIRIEDEVLVGAYAGIGPGCRIEAGAEVPVASFLRPFTDWHRQRRSRGDRPRMRA